ncbi:Apyrase [Heracleum sosnowskyi]|uniref:Apyrase n=1 Tax=Heracleum sosnowskyi TaxID=360622 RepID=A0AAD8GW27_9APIA|nr:Apyrase [Heracleum sosnowskyi]
MAFSRLAEILSAAASRLSVEKSSTSQYASPGLPPVDDSVHGVGFSRSRKKNLLRRASSLQDFSTYSQVDPEEGILNIGTERRSTQEKSLLVQRANGGASFSKEKATTGSPCMRKKWARVILVFLCLVLFAFLVFMVQFLYSNWSNGSPKFYVILDCGSTGTRVFVYKASANHNKDGGGLPILLSSLPEGLISTDKSQAGRAYNRMETMPGFDKLVHNVSGLTGAIKPLLQWAEKQIPQNAHRSTSIFLYATAGVRRLPSSDSDWLLNNAWLIMKNSSFLCQREWIKIISGMDEAFYGWIALNYHLSVLGTMPRKETYGALDLGGSSLQVTFENNEHIHNETSLQLNIGPVNHHLSAYSLSGYGLNDAFDKSVVYLLKRLPHITNADIASGNIVIEHPCLHSGYKEQYVCSQCTSLHRDDGSPFNGRGKMGKGGRPGISVQLIGAPNWGQCNLLAHIAVNLSEWSKNTPALNCKMDPCALPDNIPRPSGHFYGMSGFYVVYRFFELTSDSTLDDVLEKGREFCEKTWNVAKNSVAPQPFIEQYCFRAPYVVFLLREGLHIADSNVTIGSGSITWTLGVALLEAGKAFTTKIEIHTYNISWLKINPTVLFIILFASLVFLVCALLYVGNCTSKNLHRQYLPLSRHNSAPNTSVLNIPSPFRFKRWSPMNSGDGRVKTPLSPVATSWHRPFGSSLDFSSGIELNDSSLHPSSSSVVHSYSSGSLGQMQQIDSSNMGSVWSSQRSLMHLQSRRSQSREDLSSSLAEAHLTKT